MRDAPPRLGLVVDPDEPHRYPAHELAAAALEDGWSAEIVYDRAAPRIRDSALLLRTVASRPGEVLRTTRPQAAPPGRRLRLTMVMLAPQLLHFPSLESAGAWIGMARRLGARTLVNVASDELSIAAFEGLNGRAGDWTTADFFHVEAEPLIGLLSERGVPADRIAVIPPAVDQQLLTEGSLSEDETEELRILSVGAVSWTHCFEHAVEAIRLLHARGIRAEYRIIGRGAHLDAVVFAVHELGLQERVSVIESCTPAELRNHMRWANAFVHLAVVSSATGPVLHAHAAGVPVIGSADAAEPATSLLVPPLDPSALAKALGQLQQDRALRSNLVASGRERARQALTPEAQTTQFRALHRMLVADG